MPSRHNFFAALHNIASALAFKLNDWSCSKLKALAIPTRHFIPTFSPPNSNRKALICGSWSCSISVWRQKRFGSSPFCLWQCFLSRGDGFGAKSSIQMSSPTTVICPRPSSKATSKCVIRWATISIQTKFGAWFGRKIRGLFRNIRWAWVGYICRFSCWGIWVLGFLASRCMVIRCLTIFGWKSAWYSTWYLVWFG